MKKRLLIFHHTIAPYRVDFFNDLARSFDTRVCLQYKNLLNQKFDYSQIAAKFRFTPVYLTELLRLKSLVISSGYWRQVNEHKPDIVIVSEFGLDCLAVLFHRWIKRKKYKVISICDDSYNMVAENNDFSFIHRLLRKWIVPKLDELILVEPKVTTWYKQNCLKGICFPIIKRDDEARTIYENLLPQSCKTAKKFNLTGKYVFLFVGRLVALKNVETIMRAFAKMGSENAALVIIGDGIEREHLEIINTKEHCSALFLGRLESNELLQWYNIASCLILASYQEPFGAVTNEALLAGCKGLISTKAGSQCLIKEGKNGYTFDPMNVDELAEKMQKIMQEKNIEKSRDGLRPSQMLVRYDELHKKLVEHLEEL